jgi:hypothetical protein
MSSFPIDKYGIIENKEIVMRFLIAGLGSIGRRHFRNLIALGEKETVRLPTHKATIPDEERQAERNESIASFLPKGQAGNWRRLFTEK